VLRHLLDRAEQAIGLSNSNSPDTQASNSSSSSNNSSINNYGDRGVVKPSVGSAGSDLKDVIKSKGAPQYPPLSLIHEAVITVPAYFNPAQVCALCVFLFVRGVCVCFCVCVGVGVGGGGLSVCVCG